MRVRPPTLLVSPALRAVKTNDPHPVRLTRVARSPRLRAVPKRCRRNHRRAGRPPFACPHSRARINPQLRNARTARASSVRRPTATTPVALVANRRCEVMCGSTLAFVLVRASDPRRRDPLCPIPVPLEWAVSSYRMAPLVAEQERGRPAGLTGIKSRAGGRLLLRRFDPEAAGASLGRCVAVPRRLPGRCPGWCSSWDCDAEGRDRLGAAACLDAGTVVQSSRWWPFRSRRCWAAARSANRACSAASARECELVDGKRDCVSSGRSLGIRSALWTGRRLSDVTLNAVVQLRKPGRSPD